MESQIARAGLAALILLLLLIAGWIGGPTFGIDRALSHLAADVRADVPALTGIAALVTWFGGAAFTLSFALCAVLALLFRRRLAAALLLAITVLAERALVDWLKQSLARPRPIDGELAVTSMAFPSGHAANSMTVFLVVALLAVPGRYRQAAAISAISASLVIGLTRVLLGVHWPSDVIGGWLLGLATVALAIWIARRSGAIGLEAKHQIVGRHVDASGKDESP